MFFSSIKGINRLISKEMSNTYLKATVAENWHSKKFRFSRSKKIFSRSVFGEL